MDLQKLLKNQQNEDNLQNNYNLGLYWYNRNNHDKALVFADKALEHDEKSYESNKLKSNILFKTSKRHKNTPKELEILMKALIFVEKANMAEERNEDNNYMGTSDVKRRIAEIKAKK